MSAPVITVLPAAPQRTDLPADFSDKADAFVAALSPFRSELNSFGTWMNGRVADINQAVTNAQGHADDAAQSAIDATNNGAAQVSLATTQANRSEDEADRAELAANSAALSAGADAWVSGTTYSVGDAVYSPSNFQTFRRKTNGAGTTDPVNDSTNWQSLTAGDFETLPASKFTDTSHGQRSGGNLHNNATTSFAGFMSSSDKTKLNGIENGAQANVATNLGNSAFTTGVTITSSTGGNTTIGAATNSVAGVVTTGSQTFAGTKTFTSTISGNINTATQLQNSRTINGTAFNGTGNIVTANWGTGRTFTIGSSSQTVNGSSNMSWSLAAIGAAPTSHDHSAWDVKVLGNYLSVQSTGRIVPNNLSWLNAGMYGNYASTRVGHIWSMGTSYTIAGSGANLGNTYGLAYVGPSVSTIGGTMAGGHQGVWAINGVSKVAFGNNLWAAGNITAYSDIRVKTNIQLIPDALEKVCRLNGYTFERTDVTYDEDGNPESPVRQSGVIAQEVLEVLPEVVTGGPTENNPDGHYSVAYGNMVGILIEAIKELKAEVDDLKRQLEDK